ncbi:MAG: methylmalonyl Co-A mutase-associated GTPase MeaB [Haloferacaceae archaeon]
MTDGGGDDPDEDGEADARTSEDRPALVDDLLAGDHRALARAITRIENRAPGYRGLVSALYAHAGTASVVGVTGSPGAGKSTLVGELARGYRDRGETVGIIAVDPSSPFTGGAVLGDRIRMGPTVGDMDVFVRSMSARGRLGGLSTATDDAITALDAFGKDRILIETVGAGQNEVDVVRTADTVVVLVQPGSGDDVQMLKAGILEIGDVFVLNKADVDGADRTAADLREMLERRDDGPRDAPGRGHHGSGETGAGSRGPDAVGADRGADRTTGTVAGDADDGADESWSPPVVETVATRGEGIDDLLAALDAHRDWLSRTGRLRERTLARHAESIRRLLREDAGRLLEEELARLGGVEALAEAVQARETDPYAVADEVLAPVADCVRERRDAGSATDGDRSGG